MNNIILLNNFCKEKKNLNVPTLNFKIFGLINFLNSLIDNMENNQYFKKEKLVKIRKLDNYISFLKKIGVIVENNNELKISEVFFYEYKNKNIAKKQEIILGQIKKNLKKICGITYSYLIDFVYKYQYITTLEFLYLITSGNVDNITKFRKIKRRDLFVLHLYNLQNSSNFNKNNLKILYFFEIIQLLGFKFYQKHNIGILFVDLKFKNFEKDLNNIEKGLGKTFKKITKKQNNNLNSKKTKQKTKFDVNNNNSNSNKNNIYINYLSYFYNKIKNLRKRNLNGLKKDYNTYFLINQKLLEKEKWDLHHIIPLSCSYNNNVLKKMKYKKNIEKKFKKFLKNINNKFNLIYVTKDMHLKIHMGKTYFIKEINESKIILTNETNKEIELINKKEALYSEKFVNNFMLHNKNLSNQIFK